MANLIIPKLKRKLRTFKEHLLDNNGVNKEDIMPFLELFNKHNLEEKTFTTVRTKTNYKTVLNIIDGKLSELDSTPITTMDVADVISDLKDVLASYRVNITGSFSNCNIASLMDSIKSTEYVYSYNGKDGEVLDEPINILDELPLLEVLTNRKQFIADILLTNDHTAIMDRTLENIVSMLPVIDTVTLGYLPVLHYLTYKEITLDNIEYEDPMLKRPYTFSDAIVLLNNIELVVQRLNSLVGNIDSLWVRCLTEASLDLEELYEQLIDYAEFLKCNKTQQIIYVLALLAKDSN